MGLSGRRLHWYQEWLIFSLRLTAFLTFLLFVGLVSWLCHRQGWRIFISLNAPEGGLTDAMISRRMPQSSIADSFPVRPNCFNGTPRKFKEWCFSVELALRSRNIEKGPREVELVSSLLEGNALLWLIACQESSTVFNSWTDLLALSLEPSDHCKVRRRIGSTFFSSSGNFFAQRFSRHPFVCAV